MNHVCGRRERWWNGLRGPVGALALFASLVGAYGADDTPPTDPAKLQEWVKRKQEEGLAALAKAQAEMSRAMTAAAKPVQATDNEDKEPVVELPERDEARSAQARRFVVTRAGLN